MSEKFFISDLHLGHKHPEILKRVGEGATPEQHCHYIVSQWNSRVHKRDTVYVLGDVVFGKENLKYLKELKGNKILIRGNHDNLSTQTYLEYFTNIYGLLKKHGFWMSHAPIHPQELRGKKNVHGHVHRNTVPDERYINVCVDVLNGVPISLDEIRELL